MMVQKKIAKYFLAWWHIKKKKKIWKSEIFSAPNSSPKFVNFVILQQMLCNLTDY